MSAEALKALTPAIVLLALILTMGTAWVRDRNARIKDLKDQVKTLQEVAQISERARDLDREISRQQLEAMRTAEAAITGLRNALERREREDQ